MKYIIALLLLVSTAYSAGVDTCKSTTYVDDNYINRSQTSNNYGTTTMLRIKMSTTGTDSQRVTFGVNNFNTYASGIGSGRILDSIISALWIIQRSANTANDTLTITPIYKLRRFYREGGFDAANPSGSGASGMTWANYKDSTGAGQDSAWATAGAASTVSDINNSPNYVRTYTGAGALGNVPAINNWLTNDLTYPILTDENAHFRLLASNQAGVDADTINFPSSEYATDASKSLRFWVYWHMTGYRYCDNRATNAYKDRRY